MSFFDGIGKKLSDAGQKTIQKTKELSDSARLSLQISEEEKKLDSIYHQIGKMYISLFGDAPAQDFVELVAALRETEKKIQTLTAQLHGLRGILRCASCGAEVPQGSAFCSSCGAPMPKMPALPQAEASMKKCASCGAIMKQEMRFCTSCGSPFKDATVSVPIDVPFSFAQKNAPMSGENVCPQCGEPIEPDSAFCMKCGAKL